MSYDPENIFAKILKGEIPNKTVYEDQAVLAFADIAPQAPVHVLVIPKGEYTSLDHFHAEAGPQEIAAFWQRVRQIALDLELDKTGYRVIANHGKDSNQSVPHCHVHILGGKDLGLGLLGE